MITTNMRRWLMTTFWNFKGLKIEETYNKIKNHEDWSKEQWSTHQDLLLQDLVLHCYENVPYYSQLFDSLNLKPEDIKSKEDLKKLPILTKEIIRNNTSELIAKNIPKETIKHAMRSPGVHPLLDKILHKPAPKYFVLLLP